MEKIEFELGKPKEVILACDEPKTGTGQYGDWFCYIVKVGDQKFCWFPSESLHDLIQKLGLGKDDKAIVTKQALETNGHLSCYYTISAKGQTVSTNGKISTSTDVPNGQNSIVEALTVDPEEKRKQLGNQLYLCLLDACTIAKKLKDRFPEYEFGPTEIEKVGVSLWLNQKQ